MNNMTLRTELSEKELADALENCAKEPIHLTGAIQPHGVLFVLSDPEMEILQASNNTTEFFGISASGLIGKSIDQFLGKKQIKQLREIITSGTLQPIKSMALESDYHHTTRRFDAVIHRSGNHLVLEMEPTPTEDNAGVLQDFYDRLRGFSLKLRKSDTLQTLYGTVVNEVRNLTGFDRVKLYKFDPDWNGTVVAESRADYMPSYLNLRFPASDIPEQARKLYSNSYLRMIADIHYEPVPIIPTYNSDTTEMTDLSLSVLRSVSPVHLQYLDNMKVSASMSISIIQNQKLWGLVACHHNDPKYVPHKIRMASELVGHVFSSHLSTLEESKRSEREKEQKLLLADIAAALTPEKPLDEALSAHADLLCQVMDADGVAVALGKKQHVHGKTPNKTEVKIILDWLENTHTHDIFSTHRLSEHLDLPVQAYANAAGILSVPVGKEIEGRIVWFRNETVQQVHWAGKPEKNIAMDSVGFRLTPRGSFSLWKETLQGAAPQWADENVQAAHKISALLKEKIEQEKQQQREEVLKEQIVAHAARMKAIFDAVKEGIVTIDAKGIIQSVNPSLQDILGYSEKEVLGKNVKMLMPKVTAKAHDGYLKNYLDTGKKNIIGSIREVAAQHKDGHEVPIELAIEEMMIDGKSMFVGTIRDISERKALKESELFRDIFHEAANDGFWDWHLQDEYEYMSPRFWEILGFKSEEKKHHPSEWQSLIFEEDLPPVLKNFDEHVETKGECPFYQEVRYRHKDGSTIYVICRGRVVEWDKDGTPIRMIGTHTDITAMKKIQAQLKRSNEELDEFAYIASHDLKEPLRGIHNHTHFLHRDSDNTLSEDGTRRLNRVMELTQYMETLISDLLYFSRMGRSDIAWQKTDLNHVIQEIITSTPSIEEEYVQVHIPRKLPTIECDKVRIGEVFRNLITNAIKYNDNSKKTIEIGFKNQTIEGRKQKIFYVKDNGIGIAPEFHDEVFRIFKRLHKKSAYGGGTGSGLTFVHKIIDRHQGKIWIESEKSQGTTFYFTLPGEAKETTKKKSRRTAA